MKLWSKILGGTVVFVIAAAVALFAVLKSLDYNRFKDTIDRVVENATGRSLTIEGDLELAVSLSPTITVRGVQFANADWATSGVPMAELDRLDAKIALKPLLSGDLEIDYVILDGLRIALETDAQGRANWEFETKEVETSELSQNQPLRFKPQVRDVRLRNVHVMFHHGSSGETLEADLERADFTAAGFSSPLKGDLAATYNGVGITARMTLGTLEQLIAKQGPAFPVTLNLTAGNVQADVTATVEQPSEGLGVEARVSVEAANAVTLSRLAGVTLPQLKTIRLLTTVNGQGQTYSAKGIELTVGSSDLKGSVGADLSGARPRIVADLKSNYLNIDEIMNLPASDDDDPSAPLFSPEPLPFDMLGVANAQVQLQAKQVNYKTVTLDNVNVKAQVEERKLTVYPLDTGLEGGRLAARLSIDATGKTPKVKAHATVRDLNVGSLTALAGQRALVQLPLDGEFDIETQGSSLQALMSSLNGYTRILGRDGRVDDKRFVQLTEGFGSIFPWASNKDANVISCMLVKMPIKAGVANAETVVLDTSGVQVSATGDVNLPDETLNLTVYTRAKKTSLASFAVPVEIKGTLRKPETKVNPAAAVVGTVGNIVKTPAKLVTGLLKDTLSLVQSEEQKKEAAAKNDPCIQALSGGNTTSTPDPEPSKTAPADAPAPSEATGDPVKDLERFGEGLKNLF